MKFAGIPRSTYYDLVKKMNRPDPDADLKVEIKAIYKENEGRYGYRRIRDELVNRGQKEIIDSTGKKSSTKILSEDEYIKALKRKSFDELQEYVEAETLEDVIEELADVLEIINALAASWFKYRGS